MRVRSLKCTLLLAAAALCGVGIAFAELALYCRVAISEACVWGKTFLAFNATVYALLCVGIGLVVRFVRVRRKALDERKR